MPRPRNVPEEVVSIRLPEDLMTEVRRKLVDPVRNKTKHGGVKHLIQDLLYKWVYNDSKADTLNDL
jgi:hypothetical protein